MSHAAHAHDTHDIGWNQHDPHGIHGDAHAHGHVVVGWKLQLGVLAALLFFTALTVGFYNAEKWAEAAFNIDLPNWVNVIGAMSIATIKATLVCMYFMQLRYDKALNTFALLFCLFAVGLFVFFSIIDLSTRGRVNDFKFGEVNDGGTGVGLSAQARDPNFSARVSPRIETAGGNIANFRRGEYMAGWMADHPGKAEIDFWAYWYDHVGARAQRHPADTENYFAQLGLDRDPNEVSTANRSIPRHGRSDALDLNPGASHGASHAGDH
jgi:cytochrome c oxidase subunit 4